MIEFDRQAVKDLSKLSSKLQKRIVDALERLDNESVGDVKKLKGVEFYRLRVSDYRVIFKLEKKRIYVVHILPRGSAYKNL
jgi:mRNA interferase RelE/StbE